MRRALLSLLPVTLLALAPGCMENKAGKLPQTALPPREAQLASAAGQPTQSSARADQLETVSLFTGPMPTGVTVSRTGRIFLSFPRWADPVDSTCAELVDGRLVPFPNATINKLDKDHAATTLVSVQSVVVDPADRLWLVDAGNINFGKNLTGGPKLVCVDLKSNRIAKTINLPADVALPHTYLNDIRFDLRQGDAGIAYITDSSTEGPNGIIVVDLSTGQAWRKLNDHPSVRPEQNFTPVVEGQPLMTRKPLAPAKHITIGSDGIALSADGKTLYYRPLAGHHLYSVPTASLLNRNLPADKVASTVRDLGDLGFASDGMECDAQNRLYLTDYENHAVRRGDPAQSPFHPETLVSDPRMIWPDTLSISADNYLYITANQLNRQPNYHNGKDLRQPPYALFRYRIDGASPVMLNK